MKEYPIQFKHQVTCGEYILDFYCPKAKIAIELDGSYHQVAKISENDKTRNEYLESVGICVIRFPNTDVKHDFNQVCKQIDLAVRKCAAIAPPSLKEE